MARSAQTKNINGVDYTVQIMPPTVALGLLADLVKMLGPGLAPIFSSLDAVEAMMDSEVKGTGTELIARAVSLLCSGLDKGTTLAAIKLLGNYSSVSTGKLEGAHFEIHFAGELGSMFAWVKFALEVQYADFFGAMSNAIAGLPVVTTTRLGPSQ